MLFKDGCVPNQSPCPTPRRALPSRKITPAFVSSILLLGIRSRKNAPLEGVPSAADAAVFGKISHAKLSLIIFHPGHSYLVKPVMTSVTDAVTGSPQLSMWIPTAGDGEPQTAGATGQGDGISCRNKGHLEFQKSGMPGRFSEKAVPNVGSIGQELSAGCLVFDRGVRGRPKRSS